MFCFLVLPNKTAVILYKTFIELVLITYQQTASKMSRKNDTKYQIKYTFKNIKLTKRILVTTVLQIQSKTKQKYLKLHYNVTYPFLMNFSEMNLSLIQNVHYAQRKRGNVWRNRVNK